MDDFDQYRAEMNEKLLGSGHLGIKRFFALDTQAYEEGALDKRTKELMGLTGSIVLRCDDGTRGRKAGRHDADRCLRRA